MRDLKKTEILQLGLKTSPGVADSARYKKNAQILTDGASCEDVILWKKDLEVILVGLELTKVIDKFNITRRLLKGGLLKAFDYAETDVVNSLKEDEEIAEKHFTKCLQELVSHVVPKKDLQLQKHYMCWVMRKPCMVKILDFVALVQQLNEYLTYLPPFEAKQSLPTDEILDILEFSIPNSWQKEFERTGFDPADSDIATFVEHCERIELTEDLEQATPKSEKGMKSKTKRKFGSTGEISHAKSSAEAKNYKNNSKTEKFCKLHNCNGHSTEECKVVLAQIGKMRAVWEAKSPDTKPASKKTKYNNYKYNKQELHDLVQEMVENKL